MNKKLIIAVGAVTILIAVMVIWRAGELKKYNSREVGVAFYYPDKYFLEDRKVGSGERVIVLTEDTEENRLVREGLSEGREGGVAISIAIHKSTSSTTPIEWVKTNKVSNFSLLMGEFDEGKVAGKDALFYITDGLYTTDNLVIVRGSDIVHISVNYLTLEDPIRKDLSKILKTLYLYE